MKGISMRDLAKELGVSVASVSVALRGKSGISDETREKILRAAQRHGYDMGRLAPEKSKGIIEIIDFGFYPSLRQFGYTHPYYYQFIDAAKKGIIEQGYTPMGPYAPDDTNFYNRPPAMGTILFCEPSEEELRYWKNSGRPFVVSAVMDDEPITSVAHDNYYAILTGIMHLKELGHTHIGYLHSLEDILNASGTFKTSISETRYQSYLTLMQKNHLTVCEHLQVPINVITPDYVKTAQTIYEQLNTQLPLKATAFICDTDYGAIALMRALRNLGYIPGKDISVVGFDDMPISAVSEPPLTTIHPFESEVALACVEQLVFNIENPHARLHRHIRIGTELVLRESTCKLTEIKSCLL